LSKARPVIYLTIDDGPSKYTPQILDILREHGFTATFFQVGTNVERYPNYVKDIVNQGSYIGNHTWDHPQLPRLSNRAIRRELSRTDAALRSAGAPTPTCTRPPYGSTSTRVHSLITGRNQSQILWSVDPRDWARPGVKSIVSKVERRAVPGSVVLIHDGGGDRSQSVAAARQIADWAARRGWTIQALPVCGQFS
jgi:peptidoglycan/xylan/chitin deacetylase (PgdA/CDA1 family)